MAVSRSRKQLCPKCGEKAGVPIIYGYPGKSLIKQAKRGEVTWGGCIVEDDAPNRSCRACGHRWIDEQ